VLSEALAEVRRAETSLVFVAEPGAALPTLRSGYLLRMQ